MTSDLPKPSILVVIPPPLWALLFVLTAYFAGKALSLPTLFQHTALGWAIFALGFAVSASGRLTFAKAGTEVVPVSSKNSKLVTDGPFRMTRNPMYLGILIGVAGLAAVIGNALAYVMILVFFLFVNFISIPYEEEKMERQYGDDWRAYKARVRRWL